MYNYESQLTLFLSTLFHVLTFTLSTTLHVTKLLFPLSHQVVHPPVCINNSSVCIISGKCPPELWSVTMVFVSCVSNAIITLNSYSVKRASTCPSVSLPLFVLWLLYLNFLTIDL